jgi:hypothetical protein
MCAAGWNDDVEFTLDTPIGVGRGMWNKGVVPVMECMASICSQVLAHCSSLTWRHLPGATSEPPMQTFASLWLHSAENLTRLDIG